MNSGRLRDEKRGFWRTWLALLREASRTVRAGGARLMAIVLAMQIVITIVCVPLFRWLFRESLRASGMTGLDIATLSIGPGFTVTATLIILICLLAFWLVSLQFTLLVTVLHTAREGDQLRLGAVRTRVALVVKKLLRPSALPLLLYLFLVLPLTGFGFTSVFTQGIAIPPFISGELSKSPQSITVFALFLLVVTVLNIRFAVAVPIFSLTPATGGQAARASWRLTGGVAAWPLVFAAGTVLFLASVVTAIILSLFLLPTVFSDELSPDVSPIVAAYSLGAAQVFGLLLVGFVTAMLTALLLAFFARYSARLPLELQASDTHADQLVHASAAPSNQPKVSRDRRPATLLTVAAVCVAGVLGTANIATLTKLSSQEDTLVIAHRGFVAGGVENTLGSLDAAKAAGADLVEMDVMQTSDGEFIAMHDPNLGRLAGRDEDIKDLTLAELTEITVRDSLGHEDLIPSFKEYALHAAEIEMPLLVEIKLGGADTADHVDRLIDELESINALETNIYHSLDAASVSKLKELRPDVTVGYTMAFAALAPPVTAADFIVVEEWTASEALQAATVDAGLGFMTWTVNTEEGQREYIRRDVDGIITDTPDSAVDVRRSIDAESGLSDTLVDLMQRFVVVF